MSFRCAPTFHDLSFIVAFDVAGTTKVVQYQELLYAEVRVFVARDAQIASLQIVRSSKIPKDGNAGGSVKTLKLGHLMILCYLGCWTTKRYEFASLEKVEHNNYI